MILKEVFVRRCPVTSNKMLLLTSWGARGRRFESSRPDQENQGLRPATELAFFFSAINITTSVPPSSAATSRGELSEIYRVTADRLVPASGDTLVSVCLHERVFRKRVIGSVVLTHFVYTGCEKLTHKLKYVLSCHCQEGLHCGIDRSV